MRAGMPMPKPDKPPKALRMPETWICERCGIRFLLLFSKRVHCLAHGEDAEPCCHVGEMMVDGDGRRIAWVAYPSCLPCAGAGGS